MGSDKFYPLAGADIPVSSWTWLDSSAGTDKSGVAVVDPGVFGKSCEFARLARVTRGGDLCHSAFGKIMMRRILNTNDHWAISLY